MEGELMVNLSTAGLRPGLRFTLQLIGVFGASAGFAVLVLVVLYMLGTTNS
jgi:hypothetical protein